MKSRLSTPRTSALMGCLVIATGTHAASAPDPGDYIPAPAGASILALYAQRPQSNGIYDSGQRTIGDPGLKLDLGIVRAMHYFEVAGMPADIELILPMGRQRVDAIGYREAGLGNVIVGTSLWTLSDEQAGQHLGWAAYLSVPTGQKRDLGLVVSEDRHALEVQGGYVVRLNSSWSLDLIGQTEVYERDRTTQISRAPLVRGFAHLSYHLSDATRLAVSVRQSMGMRERLDGVTVTGSRNDTNLMLTWQQQLTETTQFQLQYQHDLKVRNGVALRGLQARLALAF